MCPELKVTAQNKRYLILSRVNDDVLMSDVVSELLVVGYYFVLLFCFIIFSSNLFFDIPFHVCVLMIDDVNENFQIQSNNYVLTSGTVFLLVYLTLVLGLCSFSFPLCWSQINKCNPLLRWPSFPIASGLPIATYETRITGNPGACPVSKDSWNCSCYLSIPPLAKYKNHFHWSFHQLVVVKTKSNPWQP